MDPVETAAAALRALREELGVTVIWKTTALPSRKSPDFSEDLYHHCTPFCRAVKRQRQEQCNRQERPEDLIRARASDVPLVKNCHAGVLELVVPVLLDGVPVGALLAGPFRPAGGRCPLASAVASYQRLPVFDPARVPRLDALLRATGAGLAHLLRQSPSPTDPRIRRAVEHLQRHFRASPRVADLAALTALSPSRFAHLFTEETGTSPAEYLMQLRLEEAKRLLADPQRGKSDIAVCAGFCDQSHFAAAFKRHTGMTPGRYQKWLRTRCLPGKPTV